VTVLEIAVFDSTTHSRFTASFKLELNFSAETLLL